MADLFDITGKIAVVTGGARGIGAMIARALVEKGVKTYITSRTEEECQQTADLLSTHGECIAMPGNLSTFESIQKFSQAFAAREEKLDILINNAGITTRHQHLEDFGEDNWDDVMSINLKPVLFMTQQLLAKLKNAASNEAPARVINIASIGGVLSLPLDNYSYTASKAGVIHLTKHLAARLAQEHITVNAISPGIFPSRMTKLSADEKNNETSKKIPLGRLGSPDDIAGTVIYLSSRAGAWVTGTNITVDGGFVLTH